MSSALAKLDVVNFDKYDAARRLKELARNTVQNLLEIGKELTLAKEALPHGDFEDWVETELAWNPSTARRLMEAYRNRITNVKEIWGNANRALTHEMKVLPPGSFDVIYADPPWEYDFSQSNSRGVEQHYPTMSLESLKSLPVPAAEDAVLFLWATAPKLSEALELMDGWGFSYRTDAVWDKEKIGMGYWFRGQHELLLVGTKGNVSAPPAETRFSSVIRSPREEHSRKPALVYQMIETMFPNQKRIELFARGKARPGWVGWGLDAE